MKHRLGMGWVGWLLVPGVLLGGCGGSMPSGTVGAEAPQDPPGIHWGEATQRADPRETEEPRETALLHVSVDGPSAVCDVAVSREEDGAPPIWESLMPEGGQQTRGDRGLGGEIAPGPLRLRVRTCDGREQSTDVRVVGEGQRIAATIDI